MNPESTGLRALDKTDDGYVGAKYLRGFVIEANTFNTARKVNVLLDGVAQVNPLTATTVFTINANGQLELPFAVTPAVGYEFQLAIDPSDTSTAGWEVFQVRWVYEQWPDLEQIDSPVISVAGGRLAYIRGFSVPLDYAATLTMKMVCDTGTVTLAPAPPTTAGKTGCFFAVLPPFLAREVQLVPNVPVRAWWNEIQWDAEPWPELSNEFSPWLEPAGGKPCHLRGFTMPIDTNGANATLTLIRDDGTTYPLSPSPINNGANAKAPVGFYLAVPQIVHSVQIVSAGSGVSAWWDGIVWDCEPWPELEPEYSPWIAPKGDRAAYLRGFVMPVDTNGAAVGFQVQLASGALVTVQSQNTTAAQKSPVAFTFLPPIISHQVRIQPLGAVRCWWDEITWDAEEYPELAEEYTPVLDCGYARAKFMQGCVLPIDTNGTAQTIQIVTDAGLVAWTSGPITTSGKQFIALSWTPFITHSVQIVPSGGARIWYGEIVWVFEPSPEQAVIWQTPMMTHGLSGYLHQRLFWLAYLSTLPVVFTRKLDNGASETYTLPGSSGTYRKALMAALPTKFLAVSYGAVSGAPFLVYVQDTECLTKQWGSNESFQSVRPIGSESAIKGADI